MSTPSVIRFDTPADFFEAMFGPAQHDAHCKTRRERQSLDQWKRGFDALDQVMAESLAEEREREAQRIAELEGYDTAVLRMLLHRWAVGGMSKDPNASVRAAQYRRALDIAIEHHGAMAVAAE